MTIGALTQAPWHSTSTSVNNPSEVVCPIVFHFLFHFLFHFFFEKKNDLNVSKKLLPK